jgi:aspartyl-tRNA(Asn)/glutamyl-tRNA(Gln) amidotransferase subunit C
MPRSIDEATVRHVANLARLRITDAEVATYAGQLSAILDYFEQLRRVDTEGVSPTAHPLSMVNVFREDTPHKSWPVERALHEAPDPHDGFFRVPKVLDQDST